MTKQERIISRLDQPALFKAGYDNMGDFIKDGKAYIKAIKEGRMICNIEHVAPSGMSRTLRFLSCEKATQGGFYYRNYFSFFKALGYTEDRKRHGFKVHGCGMDMIFDTNYRNIHDLLNLGFISKKQASVLAQQTPTTI